MEKYLVRVKETIYRDVVVEAYDEEDARLEFETQNGIDYISGCEEETDCEVIEITKAVPFKFIGKGYYKKNNGMLDEVMNDCYPHITLETHQFIHDQEDYNSFFKK